LYIYIYKRVLNIKLLRSSLFKDLKSNSKWIISKYGIGVQAIKYYFKKKIKYWRALSDNSIIRKPSLASFWLYRLWLKKKVFKVLLNFLFYFNISYLTLSLFMNSQALHTIFGIRPYCLRLFVYKGRHKKKI